LNVEGRKMRERRVYITRNRREDKCTATSLENVGKTCSIPLINNKTKQGIKERN
jgi:hypothetical protein